MKRDKQLLMTRLAIGAVLVVMLILVSAVSARDTQPELAPPAAAESAIPGQFLTGPNAGEPLDIALAYLEANRESLGLTTADLVGLESESYVTQKSDITHIQLWQTHNGIRVYNGMILINIAADGSVINLHNHFVPDLAGSITANSANLSAEEAVLTAAAHLGLAVEQDLFVRQTTGGASQAALYNDAGISRRDIPVQLIYMPTRQGVRLAWDVEVYELTSDDWWSLRVDAAGGALLDRHNYTIHEDFLAQAEEAHGQLPEAAAEPFLPGPLGGGDPQYLVYAWPVESPNYAVPAPPADARTLEVNPHLDASALGSPFGWHATGSTSWTNTQGNNVDARKSSTIRHDCGVDLDCSPALDLTVDPTVGENVDSAIVNLFYWNNIIHDVWYNYGFDEPSRNFQEDNNGQGGAGSDRVLANAQAPGDCNANFGTPGDGSNPTMNMFTCSIANPDRDGDLDNGVIIHEYTHGISNRLTGGASVSCLNNSEQMGEGWSDWYGLIMTVETGDAGSDSRGIGTWLLGQGPDGVGVRQFPYSTDMGVNPHTYGDVGSVAVPHGVGSIWSAMLWEVTWNFIDEYGFDPDIYNGSGGNNMIMQLVTDGMKLQPCSPGFVDGRDAILAADQALYGGANQCLIWEGFAKRGLGFSADQGSSGSTGDGSEAFDLPPVCLQTLKIDKSASPDPVTAGETLTYTLQIANDTLDSLSGVVISDTVPADTTYVPASATCGGSESGGVVTFNLGSMTSGETIDCQFQVEVDSGIGSNQILFEDFEDGGLANWTASGIWNPEAEGDTCGATVAPFPSSSNAAYYGRDGLCDFDTGAGNTGSLTMNSPITLTGSPVLKVWSYEETENDPTYDKKFVEISTNGGGTWSNLADFTNEGSWYEKSIDLSAFSGQSVLLRFTFEATDGILNDGLGWLIDDIEIIDEASVENTACVTAVEGDEDCDSVTTLVLASASPNYTLNVTPASQEICAGEDAYFTVNLGSVNGFNSPVTLSGQSSPGGASISFGTSPLIPAASTAMTVTAASQSYDLTVTGDGGGIMHMDGAQLTVNDVPSAVNLTFPGDGATGVALTETLTWDAIGDAVSYDIEIATDAGFSNIVDSANTSGTSHTSAVLEHDTTYYWRVKANNDCGAGSWSATYSFTTMELVDYKVYLPLVMNED